MSDKFKQIKNEFHKKENRDIQLNRYFEIFLAEVNY